jgi:hypothetical protein
MLFKSLAPLVLLVGSGESFLAPITVRLTTPSSRVSSGVASDYDRDDFVNDRHYRDRGEYAGDFRVRPTRPMSSVRGPHMDVTTANPQFMRTDRPRREGFRYSGSVRPNIQDLRGVGRMPMQDGVWDRYRYSRDRPSRFRSSRDRGMPHFIADDDEVGMPVDALPTVRDEMEEDMEEEQRMREERDIRGVGLGESMREREWRELDERRARRGERLYSQDIQGRMPMRGDYLNEYQYPGRGGRFYDERDGYFPGRGRSGRSPYEDYGGFSRRDEFENDYVRDGPFMVRGRYNRGGRDFFEDDARRYGGDRDRFYPTRSRGVYSGSIRDEPGNIGGPTQQDLFGRDSEYTSRQQSWTTGTSFDTI